MQGLWKENLGGWNHKDTKRKRQSRKNTLRDKGRALIRAFDYRCDKECPEVFRNTGELEDNKITYINVPTYESVVKKIQIKYPKVDKDDNRIVLYRDSNWIDSTGKVRYHTYEYPQYEYRTVLAYEDHNYHKRSNKDGLWKDPYSNENVLKGISLTRTQSRNIEISTIHCTNQVVKLDLSDFIYSYTSTYRSRWRFRKGGITLMYGKPLYDYVRWSFYNDGKRRKIGQKFANRMTRVRVKQWIRNGDFEKEIKNHPYEKSIDWLIH